MGVSPVAGRRRGRPRADRHWLRAVSGRDVPTIDRRYPPFLAAPVANGPDDDGAGPCLLPRGARVGARARVAAALRALGVPTGRSPRRAVIAAVLGAADRHGVGLG